MHWIFELGQADGLVQTIKEKFGDTESVVSEILWQGEVLQVNSKVLSMWPTEKVRFLFRGPGGLGVQLVDGGWSLEEWFVGLHGGNSGGSIDGYFTTLGGKVAEPKCGGY